MLFVFLRSRTRILTIIPALLLPVSLSAQQPGWEQDLRQQIHVANIGSNGLVVIPGAIVTIVKDGITGLQVSPQLAPGMAWPNAYKKGGKVGTSALQRINYSPVQQFSRSLQVGQSAYIYQIQTKSNEVVLSLQTVPSNPAEGLYRATIAFQFPKGEMALASLNEVDAFIGDVLKIDTSAGRPLGESETLSGQYAAGPSRLILYPDGFSRKYVGDREGGPSRFSVSGDQVLITFGTGAHQVFRIQGQNLVDDTSHLTWTRTGDAPAPNPSAVSQPTAKLALPSHFVNAQVASNQLDLKGDGTFSLMEDGQPYKGTFVQSGNKLELSITDTNTNTTVTIDGSKLLDASGQTWLLQPLTH